MTDNKWVEIISVRLSSLENKSMVGEMIDQLRSGRCPRTGKKITAELYVNRKLGSDWSIRLIWNQSDGPSTKTFLGSNIADMFASLGLVNHTVWDSVRGTDLRKI